MTLKPPTKTFPKLVMRDFDEEEMKILGALADLDDGDFFATIMGKKALSDFTRVLEGVEGQKEAPLRKQGSSSHDSALLSGLTKPLHMPDDLVVVRSADADEAGDYRVMRHADAVGDSRWHVTDIDPKELD